MFRTVTAPAWCVMVWTLAAGMFVAASLFVVLAIGTSNAARFGEPPFTEAQKADIKELRPNGVYTTPSTYRYCTSSDTFTYIDPSGRTWSYGETCAAWLRTK